MRAESKVGGRVRNLTVSDPMVPLGTGTYHTSGLEVDLVFVLLVFRGQEFQLQDLRP